MIPEIHDGWPMTGRAEELGFVRSARLRSEVSGVVLSGPSGIGRSRFTHEALAEAARDGWATCRIAATEAAGSIPFGAFSHLMPEAAIPWERRRLDLLHAIASAVAASGGGRPVILAIDDAHLLDLGGAALVHHLARTRGAFVLATTLEGAACPDAVPAMVAEGVAVDLELAPLAAPDVAAMVEVALQGPLDRATERWLVGATAGNPELVRHLVEEALSQGSLQLTHGVWTCTRRFAPGPRLRWAVERRVGGLSPEERRALEPLAVAGRLGLAMYEDLAGADVVRRLERRGVLAVERNGARAEAMLAYPLHREALLAGLPVGEERTLRRSIGRALCVRGLRRRADLVALAGLQPEAAGEATSHQLTDAAWAANGAAAHDHAERAAVAAVAAGGGVRASVALAWARHEQGRPAEAEEVLAGCERAASKEELALARSYLFHRVLALTAGLGLPDEAGRLLSRATRWRSEPAWRNGIRALRSWVALVGGRPADALRHGVRVAREANVDGEVAALAAYPVEVAASVIGARPEIAEHPADVMAAPDLRRIRGWSVWPRAMLLAVCGGLPEAERLTDAAFSRSVDDGDAGLQATGALTMGRLALLRGRLGSAQRWLAEAIAGLRLTDPLREAPLALALLSRASAMAGDASSAAAARDEARARLGGRRAWYEGELVRAELWTAAASGELSRAQKIALNGAIDLRDQPLARASLLHDAARMGYPARALTIEIAEIATEIGAATVSAMASHLDAVARSDADRIAEVSLRFESLGLVTEAAEAAAEAASILAIAGERVGARRMSVRSAELVARADGVRTPRLGLAMEVQELTSREREVAALAAAGLMNAEIAQRLVLSVRTVESHLYRAFSKLGIERRDMLPRSMGLDPGSRAERELPG